MAAVYFKSVVYLGVFGSIGYVLMQVAEPSEEKKKKIRETGFYDPSSNERKSQKALFLEKLKEATTDTPIYLKKSQEATEAPKPPAKREIN
jgi:hypothetical protein